MSRPAIDLEAEKKEILRRYRGLLRAAVHSKSPKDRKAIRKAFDISLEAHKDMRRKSGEPYIYHPISVARVVAEELGLDTTAIVCALLHDTVEDTYLTLDDVEQLFGTREREIVDGLTKMSGVFDPGTSAQAENFRKMLLTLSDDVRVILIKLADRLDNMRTLDHMRPDKQQKIASETLFMYAPLAHRLGLYGMKTELEDLSLKYKEPEDFQAIESKLRKGKAVRTRFINAFTLPIRRALDASGLTYEILGRPKSIYSIWMKMQKQRVSFEEVYDVFAIRIIIDSPIDREKADAWRTYSIVSDFYQPNPDRLRDWISLPKANGYESLHTTVMSPSGKWVEVQIRSKRMDEIAEKGLAAHWRYKHDDTPDAARNASDNLNTWLTQIREMLESGEEDALDFIDEFKLNLHSEEIYVFTPNGDLFSLPKGATTLDFAFRVHTQIGSRCIGAKVNHKLVPLSHPLNSGDQVEIITSRKQKPKEDWLGYVITASARSKIRHALREEERNVASDGKEKLRKWMRRKELEFSSTNIDSLIKRLRHDSPHALLMRIATGELELDRLGGIYGGERQICVDACQENAGSHGTHIKGCDRRPARERRCAAHRGRPAKNRLLPRHVLQSNPGRSGVRICHGERRHQGAPTKLLQRHQPPLKIRVPGHQSPVVLPFRRTIRGQPQLHRHRRRGIGQRGHRRHFRRDEREHARHQFQLQRRHV